MRGKGNFHVVTHTKVGITPACAGKREIDQYLGITEEDHPRVCGEKCSALYFMPRRIGSPPRMRGKAVLCRLPSCHVGITPAYAGKRCRSPAFRSMPWDHPRVCGEKCPPGKFFFMTVGSPPRVRGKVQLRNGKQTSRGITPAYAGKRWTVAGTVAARWDHPRVCGEKASLMLASDAELGSPPRMRGKVREIKTGKSRRGITPAYAGKRRRCCAFRWLPWDHPRVCGEKCVFFV